MNAFARGIEWNLLTKSLKVSTVQKVTAVNTQSIAGEYN